MKSAILAEGYIDYWMCEKNCRCLGIGVISKNGENYIQPSQKIMDKVHGTKGKLIWIEISKKEHPKVRS